MTLISCLIEEPNAEDDNNLNLLGRTLLSAQWLSGWFTAEVSPRWKRIRIPPKSLKAWFKLQPLAVTWTWSDVRMKFDSGFSEVKREFYDPSLALKNQPVPPGSYACFLLKRLFWRAQWLHQKPTRNGHHDLWVGSNTDPTESVGKSQGKKRNGSARRFRRPRVPTSTTTRLSWFFSSGNPHGVPNIAAF